ncbi:hypothetical protein D3C79_948510 [compost metagenome]
MLVHDENAPFAPALQFLDYRLQRLVEKYQAATAPGQQLLQLRTLDLTGRTRAEAQRQAFFQVSLLAGTEHLYTAPMNRYLRCIVVARQAKLGLVRAQSAGLGNDREIACSAWAYREKRLAVQKLYRAAGG